MNTVKMDKFCSANNSGEDVATVSVSSEVDGGQYIGQLASPLLMQKREASAILARIYHTGGENPVSHSAHRSTERPVVHKQTKVEHEVPRERQLVHERFRSKQKRQRFLDIPSSRSSSRRKRSPFTTLGSGVSYESTSHTAEESTTLRGSIQILLQDTTAEHAVNVIQKLNRQLRSQDTELFDKGR